MNQNQQQNTVSLDELFVAENRVRMTGAANQLQKTAQLTADATKLADDILKIIQSDYDAHVDLFQKSKQSHDAMDDLVNECYDLSRVDISYLTEEDEDTLEKMIRSQQSKRSRAKSKAMTSENYKTMLIGAISENLLRIAANKPKSSGGGAVAGDVFYTDEELAYYANNSEALKKEIRNVQSKKSIMKSKADFDETSERWQQLLHAEAQLKALRDQGVVAVNEEAKQALEVKKELEELVSTDLEQMDPLEAKKMLASIKDMLASK